MQTEPNTKPRISDGTPGERRSDPAQLEEFKLLVKRLRYTTPSRRASAAAALVEFGAPALEPLCQALHDRDESVKAAVARALGRIGDPAAVQPLMEALRRNLSGGSALRHTLLSMAPLLLILLAACISLSFLWQRNVMAANAVVAVICLPKLIFDLQLIKSNQSEFHRAVVEAIAELAEREPRPEMRTLLPVARALAHDLQQNPEGRHAMKAATDRIDLLTARLHSLPVIADGPTSAPQSLPRIASTPADDPSSLPRPNPSSQA